MDIADIQCGGLLSNKWLKKPLPDVYSSTNPLNPSQRKYIDMISNWGDWNVFQSLLETLNNMAEKRGVTIADVAARWVLDQETVGAVLVGTRLGVSDRCADALNIGWALSEQEMSDINLHARGNHGERTESLYNKIGDCGQEYRGANK